MNESKTPSIIRKANDITEMAIRYHLATSARNAILIFNHMSIHWGTDESLQEIKKTKDIKKMIGL